MKTKFDYILQLFLKSYQVGDLLPDITYGNREEGLIHIRQGKTGNLECFRKIEIREKDVIWKTWLGREIPFFFDPCDREIFVEKEGKWIIQFDLIASAFFLISGWQEYFSDARDRYGRFQYSDSVQHRLGFLQLPVVNYYFDILRTVIEKAYGKSLKPVLSDGPGRYTVCLSHDIDTCESAWLEGSFAALKKKDLLTPVKLVLNKLFRHDAWFNFREILELEASYGASSTFFFIPTRKKNRGIKNADYDLKKAKFKNVFNLIGEHRGEVGLHGSIGSAFDRDQLTREFNSFTEPIASNRFHFLLYDIKTSLQRMESAGIKIDSSFGFAERPGFRNSFCYPFQPFDLASGRAAGFYELPLTLMDGSLQKYLHLSPGESFGEIETLAREAEKFSGVVTVLWHNTHFSPYKYPGWKELYVRLLARCQQENVPMQGCSQVLKRFTHE